MGGKPNSAGRTVVLTSFLLGGPSGSGVATTVMIGTVAYPMLAKVGVAESVNAIKDRKIDAFFWVGGIPTAAVTDLAATPGLKVKLVDHGDVVEKMNAKYGNLYTSAKIKAGSYPGYDKDNSIAEVWNIIVTSDKMSNDDAYAIVKTLIERKADIIAVHKEAESFSLDNQIQARSPIPFHPGALKYFKEKGIGG